MLHRVTNSLSDAGQFFRLAEQSEAVRPRLALRIVKLDVGNPFYRVKHQ